MDAVAGTPFVRGERERVGTLAERLVRHPRLRLPLLVALDANVSACALWLACQLRFPAGLPEDVRAALPVTFATIVSLRVLVTVVLRLTRWSFEVASLMEAMRLLVGTAVGTALFVLFGQIPGIANVPRTVIALEFFFSTAGMAAYRFGPRLWRAWSRDRSLARATAARRTVVVGAGNSASLLIRDLRRSADHPYHVVGAVDDHPAKRGTRVEGKPVLGCIADLTRVVEAHRISTVMLAIPTLEAERVREILRLCSSLKVSFKIARPSFAAGQRHLTAAMLHDLSPDDLLPRAQVAFDAAEIEALLAGRRVLITGGAGSIGGEIARQAAESGASTIVLVDMNENELYLRYRRLKERYPRIEFRAEVADIRESTRLLRLGEAATPHYVFHAAAHKHVPLMEDAPEEAIKNNVFGTLNVALMASACGAERLVFISTDKAVRPSSVMGASKRIGELVVRSVARGSRTRMTAVRFGNVLGSAGSVVPIFKEQIERGGPVTVTHAECTRYFMTISEAVGLVLLAGLGDYGELCVLDMGEPIRIADLAANLITMAGYVPGVEIPVVYQGLRPGEKLHEETLTEDEERVHVVRNRIKVARSPPPPQDLATHLRALRRAADRSDRDAVVEAIRTLVPTYCGGAAGPAASGITSTRPSAVAAPVAQP